jgi:hypothetical protein
MDLSSLGNLFGNSPSLTDYLGKGKSDLFGTVSQGIAAKISSIQTLVNSGGTTDTSGVNIALSEDAQKIIKDSNGTDQGNISGVQKAGQNFVMGFFDQSGLDLSNLSPDALDLVQGLQEVVAGSAGTQRDVTTDLAEGKYNPDRAVFTLTGAGTRLRLGIDYVDGKPSKLSVTDISNGKVETAEITFASKDGKADTMTINRTQREYANGHMVNLETIDPLSVSLYA